MILGELAERTSAVNLTLVPRYTARSGRLTAGEVQGWARRFSSAMFFLCGSESYMAAVRRWLREAAVPVERIRIERFVPTTRPTSLSALAEGRRR